MSRQASGADVQCPNCGTEVLPGQQFCRSCGLNLQTAALARPPAVEDYDALAEALVSFQSRRKRMFRGGFVALVISFLLGAALPLFAGLNEFLPLMAHLIPIAVGLSGLFFVGGVALMIYSSFLPKAPDALASGRSAELPPRGVGARLPPANLAGATPNVTEHTTRKLEQAAREKGGKK